MDTTTKTAATGHPANKARRLIHCLSPRRLSFWMILALLLYTLLGFFLVPYALKSSVVRLLEDELGRSAQIEAVAFNPYTLSLTVRGFEMRDTDSVRLAALAEFFVNFQLASLFNQAWTFDEIRLVEPYVYIQRFATNETRLSRLLNDVSAGRADKTDNEAAHQNGNSLPRLVIHNLLIKKGWGELQDDLPATPVELQVGPIDIAIQELNTLPNKYAQQNVTIELPGHGRLHWEGSLALAPLHAAGKLSLENARPHYLTAYLQPLLPLDAMDVTLSSNFNYEVQTASDGALSARLDQLGVELGKLSLTGLTPSTGFLTATKIALQGGTLRYPEQTLHFTSLRIDEPTITAWLDKDGQLSLVDLIPIETASSKAEKPGPVWQFGIDESTVNNGTLRFSDQSIDPSANISVSNLQIELADFATRKDVTLPFKVTGNLAVDGQFGIDGKLTLFPTFTLDAKARIRDIPLSVGQPYMQQSAHVQLNSGRLGSDLELAILDGGRVTVKGGAQIADLAVNTPDNEPLLSWNKLNIDRFELDLGAREAADSLHISNLNIEKPFGQFAIYADKTTNLSRLMIESKATTIAATAGSAGISANPFKLVLAGIRVSDGAMDFSDLSLPLPFATHIKKLGGTISTIATDSTEPATIKLEGQVNKYGLAKIDGRANLFNPRAFTDIKLEFRNLQMPNMSPYSARFAGRKIDRGKLTMGLQYAIENGQLHGKNNIVLSNLQLGEKLDKPGATNLPLDLAVALLKDADGIIRADIPVTGDVNDPKFELGSVIREAVVGMITSTITAPFRLLGKIIGFTSDDFGEIEFLAGRADLTPPELEKITQLEKALQQRPKLGIEISGVTAPVIDVPALKFVQLRSTLLGKLDENRRIDGRADIRADIGADIGADGRETILADNARELLESVFAERHSDTPLASIKAAHTAPPANSPDGKAVLDELSYTTDLRDRLLASEIIGQQQLADLAQARAQVIRTTFLASGQLDAARIVLAEPGEVNTANKEWVTLKLRLVPQEATPR